MSDNITMITVRAASATDNGSYAYNQDRAVVIGNHYSHTTCAVFDGHGTYGEEAAMWCVDKLRELLRVDPAAPLDAALFDTLHGTVREKLLAHVRAKSLTGLNVYEEQEGIYMAGTRQPVRGGTTATILRIDHTTGAITCASVGDSEARVFSCDAGAEDEGTDLCTDHSATNPAEYARVLAFCSEKGRALPRFEYDTMSGTLSRESRCPFVADAAAPPLSGGWAPNPAGGFFHCDVRGNFGAYIFNPLNTEGLAMTRALGDFNMERFGVSHVPHVVTEPAPVPAPEATKTRAVVWASDGMWDLVPARDVAAVVRRADLVGKPEAAAAALLDLAKERTRAAFGGALGDNITVGVTYVLYPREDITGTEPADMERAVQRHRADGALPCAHSERPGEYEDGNTYIAGKPPGTGYLFSARRCTRRYVYRALDGSVWEVLYFQGRVTGAIPWHLPVPEPAAEPAPAPEPPALAPADGAIERLMAHLRDVAARPAPAPAEQESAPPELDLAFLLSGGPFRRPSSLFAEELPSPVPAAAEDDTLLTGPVVAFAALPGSTEAILSGPPRVDPATPEARWKRAGSPAERMAILATLTADHPLHCDLHRAQVIPGVSLRRSRNSLRSYGSYAPPCSGCRIGAEEEAADAADDAELQECTAWLYMRINDLGDSAIAGSPTEDRRAEVQGGIIRLEMCNAWTCFGDPTVIEAANAALAADDAAADIRRAMSIIAEAKGILRGATERLRGAPRGTAYAAYKTAVAFLEDNP